MHASRDGLESDNKPGSFRFSTKQVSAFPVSSYPTSSLNPTKRRISTASVNHEKQICKQISVREADSLERHPSIHPSIHPSN